MTSLTQIRKQAEDVFNWCCEGKGEAPNHLTQARTILRLVAALEKCRDQRDEGFAKWASAIRDAQANGPICDKYDAEIEAILEGRGE